MIENIYTRRKTINGVVIRDYTPYRIGTRQVSVKQIPVQIIESEDEFVPSPLKDGRLLWKPF